MVFNKRMTWDSIFFKCYMNDIMFNTEYKEEAPANMFMMERNLT